METIISCHFCGTTKSVKYVVEIIDPIDNKPTQVKCCNRCCAKGSSWESLTGVTQMTMHELCEKE